MPEISLSTGVKGKLLDFLFLLSGLFAAYRAEAWDSPALIAIPVLGAALVLLLLRREESMNIGARSLWGALALTFFMPFLPGMESGYPPTRFLLVLSTAAYLARFRWWRVEKIGTTAYFFFFVWMLLIAARSYEIYKRLGYGYDLAHILNILANTLEGRFLYSDYTSASILSHHIYLTLALLAPLSFLVKSLFFPQLVQIVLLAATVLITAWAVTLRCGRAAGAAAFSSVFLHPAFVGQALHEFDPGVIGSFFLSCAILGFVMERKILFAAGVIGAVLSKEHFALAAVITGIIIIRRRKTAGFLSFGMGVIALGAFIAYSLSQSEAFNISRQAALRYGSGFTIDAGRIGYLIHMFLPTGGLALLSWPALLPAIPELAINVTSQFPMHHLAAHYATLTLPFLALAVGESVAALAAKKSAHGRWASKFVVASSVFAAIFSNIGPISHTGLFYDVLTAPRSDEYRRLDSLVARIPPGTIGVRGNHRLLIYFARRDPAIDLSYLDTSEKMAKKDFLVYDNYEGVPTGFTLIDSEGPVRVYERVGSR